MKPARKNSSSCGGFTFVPASMAHHIPFALGIVSMPLSLLFDPDSFYFGVMPIIAETHAHLGGDRIQVAQAALPIAVKVQTAINAASDPAPENANG